MKFCMVGRGVMASRVRELLQTRFGPAVKWTDDGAAADAIFLADREETVADWFAANGSLAADRPCYDFSGYAKRQSTAAAAGLDVLFAGEVKGQSGVISLPGCYASTVLLPVLYLRHRYGLEVQRVRATCLGGRSTLGESKEIAERTARLASEEGTRRHRREIAQKISMAEEQIDLTVLVGDLTDGILADCLLETEGAQTLPFESLTVTLEAAGWQERQGETADIRSLSGEESTSCRFTVAKQRDRVRVISYAHNLDLPIEIAFLHLEVARQQAGRVSG